MSELNKSKVGFFIPLTGLAFLAIFTAGNIALSASATHIGEGVFFGTLGILSLFSFVLALICTVVYYAT